MTRSKLIEKTIADINKLPDQNVKEVSDFAEFLLSKLDDQITSRGIEMLTSQSPAFSFLQEDEEIYKVDDLKEKYK